MNALLLTHGAGSGRDAALLVAMDQEFAKMGWIVERVDLAFRKSGGRPGTKGGKADQDGLAVDLEALRSRAGAGAHVYFGGHSYGGRQGSMLLSERPELADGMLLMGYPLHPPGKPEQMRTAHFAALRVPALFVSGTKDEFGSEAELREALALIAEARTKLVSVEGARHDLKAGRSGVAARIASEFAEFVVGEDVAK